jgi:hypothetical protein
MPIGRRSEFESDHLSAMAMCDDLIVHCRDRGRVSRGAQIRWRARARPRLLCTFDAGDIHHDGVENGAQLEDVQKAAGHRDPGTTKLYDRRGYNPEKAASFFATY